MTDNSSKPSVAYFCMEYGLDERMRIYAGGLGVLAGDILKTAREIDYPLLGIGILWRKGYTKQLIGDDNRPYDSYPAYDYMYDFLDETGIKVKVRVKERDIYLKVWKLEKFNNSPLYLLDANLPENEDYKWITENLYAFSEEERIAQEIVLGIGGIRALNELEINIDVYHFNEGHAVLAATELITEKMEQGLPFKSAWQEIRDKIVFTTHTPVREGNESHDLNILNHVGAFNGLTWQQMEQIGGNPFNMTVAGLRVSRIANGVAKLHGKTSRRMWNDVEDRAPIRAITNGVNRSTWTDKRIIDSYYNNNNIWSTHQELKSELLTYIEENTGQKLSEDKLLIGFARRAATYKRPDLIFRNPDIIGPYLEKNRIQLVFSGKAHPLDENGKNVIAHLVHMSNKYPDSVVFLEDYNMEIGKLLTRGVDVWLNNPRKPLEASGTSGMKAAMNGVLNLSVLDGWWPEACNHGVNGWQFGDGYIGEGQDEHDLKELYKVLLEEVVPTYYENRNEWKNMMKNSISSTYERFSARKMLNKYHQQLYRKIAFSEGKKVLSK